MLFCFSFRKTEYARRPASARYFVAFQSKLNNIIISSNTGGEGGIVLSVKIISFSPWFTFSTEEKKRKYARINPKTYPHERFANFKFKLTKHIYIYIYSYCREIRIFSKWRRSVRSVFNRSQIYLFALLRVATYFNTIVRTRRCIDKYNYNNFSFYSHKYSQRAY